MTTEKNRPQFIAKLVHGPGDNAAWTELAGLWLNEEGDVSSGKVKTGITTTEGMRLVILPNVQADTAA